MKPIGMIVVLALMSSIGGRGQNEENHWQDYQRRTLKSIVDMHSEDITDLDRTAKKKAMLLTGDNFPSQTVLSYTGKSRPLPADKERLLQAWRRMLKAQAPPHNEFQTEVLFREGAQEYWIAMQRVLFDALPKQVKNGQTVRAYVVWVGAIREGKNWKWLFAMNEFVPCQPDNCIPK